MRLFIGEYTHTIDEKGRIAVPSKMRDETEKTWIVTKGLDRSLMIYPQAKWTEIIMSKIAGLNPMIADNRIFIRTFVSPAIECEEDKLGRLYIPNNLLTYAEIEKEAVFLGAIHRIELFSMDNFTDYDKDPEGYIERQRGSYERITEKMSEIGL